MGLALALRVGYHAIVACPLNFIRAIEARPRAATLRHCPMYARSSMVCSLAVDQCLTLRNASVCVGKAQSGMPETLHYVPPTAWPPKEPAHEVR